MDFDAIKQKRSDRLAQQIEQLSVFKACVDAAVDQAAMGACQRDNVAAKKAMSGSKGQIDAQGLREGIQGKNK